MDEKIKINKRDLMSLTRTVNCLTDQVIEEQKTSSAIGTFWSEKYSLIKGAIIECKDMNELKFIKRNIKENTLTEEALLTYKRRKKYKEK